MRSPENGGREELLDLLQQDGARHAHVRAGRNNGARACRPVSFDALFERADFVSIHAPLTRAPPVRRQRVRADEADGVRGEHGARGALVDEQALAEALEAGCIAAAALDVLEQEAFYLLPSPYFYNAGSQ